MDSFHLHIAVIAHNEMKSTLCSWIKKYQNVLLPHTLVATENTGKQVQRINPTFSITSVKSGPLGGDQQIGAMITEDKLDAMFFFRDPLSSHPHQSDVEALVRLAILYDLPFAHNTASADLLIHSLVRTADPAQNSNATTIEIIRPEIVKTPPPRLAAGDSA